MQGNTEDGMGWTAEWRVWKETMSIKYRTRQISTPKTDYIILSRLTPSNRLAAAAAGSALYALALADGHCWLVVDGGGAHALLDLASHG